MFQIKLKELREAKGISQYTFAKKIGVAQSTVGGWEAGKREPNYKMLQKIADYFGVTVGYLLGTEQKEKPTLEDEQKKELLDSGFLRVMQKAKEKGYSPKDIQLVLDFLEQAKKRDEENG